jgi:hypothetical protein
MELTYELIDFIKSVPWTYAKTMPDWPHEYIVRDRGDEPLFVELVKHIREYGYEGKFYSKSITYYDHEGMTYWTMGAPIPETIIINRCKKDDTYEVRLKQGRLPK